MTWSLVTVLERMGRHSRRCWVLKLGTISKQVAKEGNAKKQRNGL